MQTKLSSKGQVILPKAIRNKYQWSTGLRFSVEETAQGVLLKPVKKKKHSSLASLAGCLAYTGEKKSLTDMEDAIKKASKRNEE